MEVGFLRRGREEQTWRALTESQEQAFGSLLRKGSIARSKRANPDWARINSKCLNGKNLKAIRIRSCSWYDGAIRRGRSEMQPPATLTRSFRFGLFEADVSN